MAVRSLATAAHAPSPMQHNCFGWNASAASAVLAGKRLAAQATICGATGPSSTSTPQERQGLGPS
eukprot:289143-Alexandrium_andersonii.AAC.1